MIENAKILEKIVLLASKFSSKILERFCNTIERLETNFSPNDLNPVIQSISQPPIRQELSLFLDDWQNNFPEISPRDMAWALRGSSVSDEFYRKQQTVELVWTGPSPAGSTLRKTDQAILEVINSSNESLIIVTFVAYKIPIIANALINAAERGVSISLILETTDQSKGKVEFNAIKALGEKITSKATIYILPLDQRKSDEEGRHGSLHVKCAIADSNTLFLSSANLTEFAFNLNMEMGLFIQGGELPIKATNHFKKLISQGALKKFC